MGIIIILIIVGWFTYRYFYFKSKKFIEIKESIRDYTSKCNELNEHIEELKNTYINIKQVDYGQANYIDNSRYNFKRPEHKKNIETKNIYKCSSTVCNGAKQQPFKYICKYFNIKTDEETLKNFESVLNNFSAAEQGKILLTKERDEILNSISNKIPYLIRALSKKSLIKKLGFNNIDFTNLYFPKYSFYYISAGGNSSTSCDIILDIDNLDRFIKYLSELVKFRKSIAGQRALMTSALREKIKQRDEYTCKNCGLSTIKEPNLLLEIDHIIPLSKEGITSEDNLQTLCWRCNRSKGSKIL
ncbi:MAG: HNH endonuclease signature motif containing protein [Clostridia bacterium]